MNKAEMLRHLRVFVFVLGGGALLLGPLFLFGPDEPEPVESAKPPLVNIHLAQATDYRPVVQSQGQARAYRSVVISAQVGGEILEIGPGFREGGRVAKGEVLAQIDPQEFQWEVDRLEAQLRNAEQALLLEQARSEAAEREWRLTYPGFEPPAIAKRQPQLESARAAVAATTASLSTARLRLEQSTIQAPFAGIVRGLTAQQGQVVNRGTPVLSMYALDRIEIPLPLTLEDMELLGIGPGWAADGPGAVLEAALTNPLQPQWQWVGRISQVTGAVDAVTGLSIAIAEVKQQWSAMRDVEHSGGNGSSAMRDDQSLLLPGMFVEAQLASARQLRAMRVPTSALQADGTLWVVENDRLRNPKVSAIEQSSELSIITSGLKEADQVVTSRLASPQVGQPVRIYDSN